ncbi:MAG: hypothetical protein JEZ12_16065 [Desulfobacterium sp.]|nr:hypothetical protein [Desulfobacterium sp.]
MKLLKKLESRINPNSKRIYKQPWGLFLCPACKMTIEKSYHNGIRQKTCGCTGRAGLVEAARKANTKHGECKNGKSSRLYNVWQGMKKRCYDPKSDSYKWYGARGIYVCKEWKNNFKALKEWALKNGYQDDLQIDRKDNDGPYAPWNCQFITLLENTRKQTTVKLSPEKAEEIKFLYEGRIGLTEESLGELYGVSGGAIHKILHNMTWANSEVVK